MKLVKSTLEILALKALNRDINKTWVDWAVEMLIAGFDTETSNTRWRFEPYNQFHARLDDQVLEIATRLFGQDQTIKTCLLPIDKSLDGELDNFQVLDILKILHRAKYEKYLYDSIHFTSQRRLILFRKPWYWTERQERI